MERKQVIQNIVSRSLTNYMCAQMADTLDQMKNDTDRCDDWLFKKINEYHITPDEFKEAIEAVEKERGETNVIGYFPADIFSTRFFRK